jgi:hypothetical protein
MHSTIQELFLGNLQYMANMSDQNPGLLRALAKDGQRESTKFQQSMWQSYLSVGPPFMLIDCSDSRVNEQEIFSAQPATLFTAANIANRFDENDPNSCVLTLVLFSELSDPAPPVLLTVMPSFLLLWNLSRSSTSLFSVTMVAVELQLP